MNYKYNWTKKEYKELINYLYSVKEDEKFLLFSKKLVTTKYNMIGIKIPRLRTIAKEISRTNIISFLNVVEDNTYEEVLLQGFVISYIKNINESLNYFNNFIKKIDNWSICDSFISSMKIVKKYKEKYFEEIKKYLKSKNEFIVRVGLILLLDYYIDDYYIDNIFILIDSINRDEYYINMAIAWLVSMCFVKYKNKTYNYLKDNKLNKFTYNKALQKMIESFRVSDEDKDKLRKMKRI